MAKQIPLRRRDGTVRAYALVDDADFEELSQWRWSLSGDGAYVRRGTRGPGRRYINVQLHRQILGLGLGDPRMGEHENRNPLDNRRANLRIAPRGHLDNKQNLGLNSNNKSGHRGVSWDRPRQKWRAQVKLEGKVHMLGRFDELSQAAAAAGAFRAEHMPFSEDARLAA